MRSSGYVGQVVSVYRAALDRLESSAEQTTADLRRLKLAFNRGGSFYRPILDRQPKTLIFYPVFTLAVMVYCLEQSSDWNRGRVF